MTPAPAPPPAPAPEAATPLPAFLGHPDDLAETWIAETWEPDPHAAWDREDMMSAYREGRDEARRQLAPQWDALAARLAGAQAELAKRDEALAALDRVVTSQARSMFAALIDVRHGRPTGAASILFEALDGFDGPQLNDGETGLQWLERTREAAP